MINKNDFVPAPLLWFSFASMSAIYILMLLGVYLSSTHQSLSCPDWPLCPNGFGLPEEDYLIEYLHRVAALITAILIYAMTYFGIKNSGKLRTITLIASFIVSIQLLVGMLVINTKLEPLVVALHLSSAVLLFSMTLLTFIVSYRGRKLQYKIK